jgi:hypothetical protein
MKHVKKTLFKKLFKTCGYNYNPCLGRFMVGSAHPTKIPKFQVYLIPVNAGVIYNAIFVQDTNAG